MMGDALAQRSESFENPVVPATLPGTVTLADSIHKLSPFVIRFSEDHGIRWYGLSYVIGFIAAFLPAAVPDPARLLGDG